MRKAVIPGLSAHEQMAMISGKQRATIERESDNKARENRMSALWSIHFFIGKNRYWFAVGIANNGRPCSTELWLSRPGDGDKLRHTSSMSAQNFMDSIWQRFQAAA